MTATRVLTGSIGKSSRGPARDAISGTIRVLHLINGEHYSGAERVQDLLAGRLPRQGVEVMFGCVKAGRFAAERVHRDAPLHEFTMHGKLDIRPARRVARLIRDRAVHLIHAHTPRTALLGSLASRLTGVPLVYHVHSPAARDSTRSLANRLNHLVERICAGRAARLITVSNSLRRHMLTAGFGEDRVTVVPNGVPVMESIARRPPAGEWTLGTVALFRPRKGTEILLDALAALRRQQGGVRLLAVGPFESEGYERALKDRADRLGITDAVHWAGFTRDVNGALAGMDLFVLPSLFGEGLPMVVLEAMAAGLPVVGTDVEGVPEAIRDGLDGVIAAAGDAAALASAIGRVLGGELNWEALAESARRRQRESFSDDSMAAGVAAVYREVLGSRQALLENAPTIM